MNDVPIRRERAATAGSGFGSCTSISVRCTAIRQDRAFSGGFCQRNNCHRNNFKSVVVFPIPLPKHSSAISDVVLLGFCVFRVVRGCRGLTVKYSSRPARIFGGTPKTTVETTVPPEAAELFQLNLTHFYSHPVIPNLSHCLRSGGAGRFGGGGGGRRGGFGAQAIFGAKNGPGERRKKVGLGVERFVQFKLF